MTAPMCASRYRKCVLVAQCAVELAGILARARSRFQEHLNFIGKPIASADAGAKVRCALRQARPREGHARRLMLQASCIRRPIGPDKACAFPNKTTELLVAKVRLELPNMQAKLNAKVWCVKGFVFSIDYDGSGSYFEEVAGMDLRPEFKVSCELTADLAAA